MTVYHVYVGKKEFQVEISDRLIRVDGEPTEAGLTPLNEGGLYLLERGNQKRELHVKPKDSRTFSVMIAGRSIIAQVERFNSQFRRRSGQSEAGELRAPMPGLIINVSVKEGEIVHSGQVVILMESMKMQMELRAQVTGKVARVFATPGAQVDKGALLLQIASV